MPSQLDRIEELLVKLVDAHPQVDMSRVNKADVSAMVIGMISDMAAGRQIEAIKAYRHLTGYGLKESKDAIMSVTRRYMKAGIDLGDIQRASGDR